LKSTLKWDRRKKGNDQIKRPDSFS
jgi:hypothetical protein